MVGGSHTFISWKGDGTSHPPRRQSFHLAEEQHCGASEERPSWMGDMCGGALGSGEHRRLQHSPMQPPQPGRSAGLRIV